MAPFPPTAEAEAAARDLVESIALDYGQLTEEDFSKMDPQTRARVKRAFKKKDEVKDSSVATLVKDLRTKDVHFVFELLQNADDNSFRRASDNSRQPCLIFRVYHDRVVVDCNEDGFEEENLRALCNVGQTSKLGRQGYIGQRGIGFKSVFKYAWKVHIQSGPFSFCFKHRPEDAGMGMISPEWHPPEVLFEPITRMTFFLHDDGDDDMRSTQRSRIVEELNQFEPSMMLFLKNLRRIEMHIFDTRNRKKASTIMTRSDADAASHTVIVRAQTAHNDDGKVKVSRSTSRYHLTKGKATGLAKNESRTYSQGEEKSEAYSTAEIVLAFPLDDNSVPVVAPQQVFAFQPIRHVGFNFLIHSDFVITADRGDIVTSSLRNQGLREHIANTFMTAVRQMCDHAQLRFQWMRFLPQAAGCHTSDKLWNEVVHLIKRQALSAQIMVPPLESQPRRTITEVKQFPKTPSFLDQHGDPLFEDLDPESPVYLSRSYQDTDLDILRNHGLGLFTIQDMIDRVKADLPRTFSKMKYNDLDFDWHSRTARLLKYLALLPPSFEPSCSQQLRSLQLIPLGDWMWVSSSEGKIYLPTTSEGVKIPPGLGYPTVRLKAAEHPDRRDLFLALGVMVAKAEEIRLSILESYKKPKNLQRTGNSVALLQFLYLTQPKDMELGSDYTMVVVEALNGKSPAFLAPSKVDVYLSDDANEYGPIKLGLKVNFLAEHFLKDPPVKSGESTATAEAAWKSWLHKSIGVRERLRLVSLDGSKISDEVLYVAEHLPERFLGLLHHLWPYEGEKVQASRDLCHQLEALPVLCEGGEKCVLPVTILPTPQLKLLAHRQYLRLDEDLRFLKLPVTLADGNISEWTFLKNLNVTIDDDLEFYMDMLESIADGSVGRKLNPIPQSRILHLYKAMHEKFIASASPEKDREYIRFSFRAIPAIYVPGNQEGDGDDDICCWATPEDCLLDAPADLLHRYPVDTLYYQVFRDLPVAAGDLGAVKLLFRDTLGIPTLSWRDYVEELRFLRDEKCSDFDLIEAQYKRLRDTRLDAEETKELRTLFEEDNLIRYCVDDEARWYKTTECLWSTRGDVHDLVNLASAYDPDLEGFFVNLLQVSELTLQLVYDKLLTLIDYGKESTVHYVKQQLLTLNSFLRDLGEKWFMAPTASPLLEKRIFPIKFPDGRVLLFPANTGFTIIDRVGPVGGFRDVVKTLDFTLDEVHELEPFIEWARLQHRYLSRMVAYNPEVGPGEKFPVSDPRFDVRRKAHGLVRIAKYFRSPRFSGNGQALYDLLRHSETWETDDFSSLVTLYIAGEVKVMELKQGDIYTTHISEGGNPSSLKIFIPHDRTAQDVCIQQDLPQRLVKWLMKTPYGKLLNDKAVGIVKGLLNARIVSIPGILTQEGIPDIDLENRDAEVDKSTTLVILAPPPPRTPPRSLSSKTSEFTFTPPKTPLTAPNVTSPTPTQLTQQRSPPPLQAFELTPGPVPKEMPHSHHTDSSSTT